MNIYEDEDPEAPFDLREFLRKNKQLVIMAVAFVFAYSFMSMTSRQLDEAVAAQNAERAASHSNPWAKDR